MMKPTIHLNGSGKKNLSEQYMKAIVALCKAIDEMHAAAPHGRDYYTQGDQAFSKARAEHDDRIKTLQRVVKGMEELLMHVLDAP